MAKQRIATRTQDGVYDHTTGVWTDPGPILIDEMLGTVAGFRFEGLARVQGGVHEAVRIDSSIFTVQIVPLLSQLPLRLQLYALPLSRPPSWQNGLGPALVSGMGTFDGFLVASRTISSGTGSQTLTLNLDFAKLEGAKNRGPFSFQGAIALSLHAWGQDLANPLEVQEETATFVAMVETNLFTGIEIEGGFRGIQSRADICPRCGNESLRQTWVHDEFLGRMVCGRCGEDPDTDKLKSTRSPTRKLLGED